MNRFSGSEKLIRSLMTKDRSEETGSGLRASSFDVLSSFELRPSSFFRSVANLGVQAAAALEHAHQMGIIHRDIKPANLLVASGGCQPLGIGIVNSPVLWVTDFGLAHCQSQLALTMTGDLLGTLRYMSPEQALAKRGAVDVRTDIYSLGVTLYELLTLEPAYNGRNREEVLRQIAFDEPRPPRRLNRSIPAELETIVLKAMDKSPAERYATAQELADDLKRYLHDEPIRARRPSVWQRLRKWARRHQAVVATVAVAAAVFLVLAVVGLAISNALITREKGQKEAALDQAQANYETAEANFELAFKAVDDIYEQFAEKFAAQPHLQPLQREFLQKALSFYQEFAKRRGTDRRLRRRTAGAYLRMGTIQWNLGQRRQAEEPYARAVALFEELVAADPAETRCREALASAHLGLNMVFKELGRKEEAQRHCRRAIVLRTELSSEFPDNVAYGFQLSHSYRQLGLSLEAQPSEAEAAFRFSIKLGEKLAAKLGDKPELRALQTACYLDLGLIHQHAGRYQEAERAFREVIALQQRGAPASYTARAYFVLGQVLSMTSRPAEAEDAYRQAIAQYEKLAAQFPHHESIWLVLYEDCYPELIRLLEKMGRHRDEAAIHRRALERYAQFVAELPDEPAYRDTAFHVSRHLGAMLKNGGEQLAREAAYRRALELAERLVAKLMGGGNATGSFTGNALFPPDAVLEFGGDYTLRAGSSVTVPNVLFSGGTITVNDDPSQSATFQVTTSTTVSGSTVNFNPGASVNLGDPLQFNQLIVSSGTANFNDGAVIDVYHLELTGGTLTGSDEIDEEHVFQWYGGTLSGLATTNANGLIEMNGSGVSLGRSLNNNYGAILYGPFSSLTILNGGSWGNMPGVDFEIRNNGTVFGPGNFFNMAGATVTRDDNFGPATFSATFNNDGVVNVQSGTLILSGNSNDGGSFTGASGATLVFAGGTHLLRAGSSLTMPNVVFSGGNVEIDGTYDVAESTTASGATVVINTMVSQVGGQLTVSGGSLSFNGGGTVFGLKRIFELSLDAGTLGGSLNMEVEVFTWWGGSLLGGSGASTTVDVSMDMASIFSKTLGRSLSNDGNALWTGNVDLTVNAGAVFNNGRDAAFRIENDQHLGTLTCSGTFNNSGTVIKDDSWGTTTFGISFTGTPVDVQTGNVIYACGGGSPDETQSLTRPPGASTRRLVAPDAGLSTTRSLGTTPSGTIGAASVSFDRANVAWLAAEYRASAAPVDRGSVGAVLARRGQHRRSSEQAALVDVVFQQFAFGDILQP